MVNLFIFFSPFIVIQGILDKRSKAENTKPNFPNIYFSNFSKKLARTQYLYLIFASAWMCVVGLKSALNSFATGYILFLFWLFCERLNTACVCISCLCVTYSLVSLTIYQYQQKGAFSRSSLTTVINFPQSCSHGPWLFFFFFFHTALIP